MTMYLSSADFTFIKVYHSLMSSAVGCFG